ncbi:hypothetical protein KSW81_001153 [Nannochloris sp. 'desiccata']|nr:hypothetical protein KSW81_001153 [Chlorella desiccata (nom. nud.)]
MGVFCHMHGIHWDQLLSPAVLSTVAEISNVQPGDVDGFRELLGRGWQPWRQPWLAAAAVAAGGGSEENPVIVNFSVHVSCSFHSLRLPIREALFFACRWR